MGELGPWTFSLSIPAGAFAFLVRKPWKDAPAPAPDLVAPPAPPASPAPLYP
jgi:hypothetical protein